MSCFPCFQSSDETTTATATDGQPTVAQPMNFTPPPPQPAPMAHDNDHNHNHVHEDKDPFENPNNAPETDNHTVKSYTFRELATATKHFRQECLLGEGGFGKVFKGTLPANCGGQAIVVRQLHRNGAQASHEFVNEVSDLSFLRHPNLVKINGYCADGEQRILVYEYMPAGSLKNRLFELPQGKQPLDWSTRMKIALGIAEGLEFLHEKADTPVVYRDLKSSNILLDEDNKPKLADYGLAKLVTSSNNKMIGGNGYIAPEYEGQGEVTMKSDVYSFGVVLLELITGRRALDTSLPNDEQNLVAWAQPIFKDPTRFPDMADPLLQKQFPVMSLNQAVGVAAMCLQEEPIARPLISDISGALSFLATAPPVAPAISNDSGKNDHSDSESEDDHNMGKNDHSDSESEDDHKMESESEDEEIKITSLENKQVKKPSSDFEYGESSSESSDNESVAKSRKLVSDSKRMSKKKSVAKKADSGSKRASMKKSMSKKVSESNRSSWSSLSSDEYSVGFSLRLDESDFPDDLGFPDKSESMASRHDDKYGHHNNDSSDSDDSE